MAMPAAAMPEKPRPEEPPITTTRQQSTPSPHKPAPRAVAPTTRRTFCTYRTAPLIASESSSGGLQGAFFATFPRTSGRELRLTSIRDVDQPGVVACLGRTRTLVQIQPSRPPEGMRDEG